MGKSDHDCREEDLAAVEASISSLDEAGPLRAAAQAALEKARAIHGRLAGRPSCAESWPALYCLLVGAPDELLQALEVDLGLVQEHTPEGSKADAVAFLDSPWREFHGGLHDIYVKAALLRKVSTDEVTLEYQGPSGTRNCDALAPVLGVDVAWEATVLSESDDDMEYWETVLAARAEGDTECSAQMRMTSAYHPILRVYNKVFEKLAPDFALGESQFPEEHPGILVLANEAFSAFDQAILWAFDELFADQPKGDKNVVGGYSITLGGWMRYRAQELAKKGKLDLRQYCEDSTDLIQLPRRISGVLLLGREGVEEARLNYYANRRLTHAQMATAEAFFTKRRPY